ncbi:MAG: zinc finger domain-containing protein [Candidatus Njordarchaeales archaeon]
MKVANLFRVARREENEMPTIRDRRSITEPRYIDMPRCSSCSKVISPRDIGAIAMQCPNCGEGVLIRCSKCRKAGNIAKCPVCGYEYP